ncbi:hypothetical protein [Bradyrhizobium sp. CB3481]|uniref:hypothetical protein n=1 Tax=Bradyrhizobium sp. CB3481 TaxID=3039158 RepID=UPI0024B241F2|nr:hypothetical protein [Bradyrhizobium sp. CB3481]WFU14546.1 hypothetical protein QA643_25780 [Bradyrhizobium sp. CB3481]
MGEQLAGSEQIRAGLLNRNDPRPFRSADLTWRPDYTLLLLAGQISLRLPELINLDRHAVAFGVGARAIHSNGQKGPMLLTDTATTPRDARPIAQRTGAPRHKTPFLNVHGGRPNATVGAVLPYPPHMFRPSFYRMFAVETSLPAFVACGFVPSSTNSLKKVAVLA